MKIIKLLFIALIFFSLISVGFVSDVSAAEVKKSDVQQGQIEKPSILLYAYPLVGYIRYDRSENQDYRRFDPRLFGAALEFKNFEISFELAQFDTTTQSGSLSIRREEQEAHFWGRYKFINWNWCDLFAGAAMGSYNEKIKTTLGANTSENVSQWNWSAGAALGINFKLNKYVLSSLEIRSIFGKDFDPQPQMGAVLRLGVRF